MAVRYSSGPGSRLLFKVDFRLAGPNYGRYHLFSLYSAFSLNNIPRWHSFLCTFTKRTQLLGYKNHKTLGAVAPNVLWFLYPNIPMVILKRPFSSFLVSHREAVGSAVFWCPFQAVGFRPCGCSSRVVCHGEVSSLWWTFEIRLLARAVWGPLSQERSAAVFVMPVSMCNAVWLYYWYMGPRHFKLIGEYANKSVWRLCFVFCLKVLDMLLMVTTEERACTIDFVSRIQFVRSRLP